MQNAGSRLKNRQTTRHDWVEIVGFTCFLTNIFARTERKFEHCCKIIGNNLRFLVDDLMSWLVGWFVSLCLRE